MKIVDREAAHQIVEKIRARFVGAAGVGALMKVKVVIGLKLFKKRQAEIKQMIEESSHLRCVFCCHYYYFKRRFRSISVYTLHIFYREDRALIMETFSLRSTPKMDKFAAAFQALEEGKDAIVLVNLYAFMCQPLTCGVAFTSVRLNQSLIIVKIRL